MTAIRLFAIALGVRMGVLGCTFWMAGGSLEAFQSADSAEYLRLAAQLATEGTFGLGAVPEIHRTPGYPLLLAAGFWVGAPFAVALTLQAVLGAASAVLVWLAARIFAPPRQATWAGMYFALDPVQLAWGAQIMAEASATFWMCLGALAAGRALAGERNGPAALAAAAFAIAAYHRPVALAAVFAWPIALGMHGAIAGMPARGASRAGRAALVAALLLAPWCLRNGLVAGYWGFTSKVDRVLAWGVPAGLADAGEPGTYEARRDELARPAVGQAEAAELERGLGRGLAAIRQSPVQFAVLHARGMVRVLVNPGSLPLMEMLGGRRLASVSQVVRREGSWRGFTHALESEPVLAVVALALIPFPIALFAACVLAVARPRGRGATAAALAVVAGGLVLASGGHWGQSRFRHPITPLLLLLAVTRCSAELHQTARPRR